VIAERSGPPIWSIGDITSPLPLRSLTKPFVAAHVIRRGVTRHYGFSNEAVALIAGSHSGTTEHVAILEQMLLAVGIAEDALHCGAILPLGVDALKDLFGMSVPQLRQLHCNCSGEHIGLLAACAMEKLSLDNYEEADHPLQRSIRDELETALGERLGPALIDGCNLPTYATSLFSIARLFAALGGEESRSNELEIVRNAILAKPHIYGGRGRFVTDLIEAGQNTLIAKDGAEGVFAVGFRDGRGLAVKIADGAPRAVRPVVSAITDQFQLVAEDVRPFVRAIGLMSITTNTGVPAGTVEATSFGAMECA
jgi:L-asparaginase II